MKKSFFTIASLAMVLALVGCSGTKQDSKEESKQESTTTSVSTSDSGSGSGEVEVPVAEGKVTVYFTADFDGVELASYASINLAGGFTSWDTGHPELTEVQQLEGTNVFYRQVTAPEAGTIYYKIILGYNTTSGYADAELGVNWTNEGTGYPDGDFGPGDGGNKTVEFAGTEQKVNLGAFTWKTMLPEPVLSYHEDVKMYVDFYEDIPAGHHVYIMGGMNGWSATEMVKTADTDVIRYQAQFTHVLEKTYEFKVKVHPDALDTPDFNVWSGGFEVNTANAEIAVNSLFDRGARNIYGTDAKRFPCNQLASVVAAQANDAVEFVGVVGAMCVSNPYAGIYVGDRDLAIDVYKCSNSLAWVDASTKEALKFNVGDTVLVKGKIEVYKGQMEVVPDGTNDLITKVEDHHQEVSYADVNRAFVAGLSAETKTAMLNKLIRVNGKVTAVNATENNVTLTVEVDAAKEAEGENPAQEAVSFTVFADKAKNLAAFNALAAVQENDVIEVKGALGAYNDTFQLVAPEVVAQAA